MLVSLSNLYPASKSPVNQRKTLTPNALKLSEEYGQMRSKTTVGVTAITTGTTIVGGMMITTSTSTATATVTAAARTP